MTAVVWHKNNQKKEQKRRQYNENVEEEKKNLKGKENKADCKGEEHE